MIKKICFIICVLLLAGIGVYLSNEYIGKSQITTDSIHKSVIHAPYYKKNHIVSSTDDVNNKGVKKKENNVKGDIQKQLSISFLKKVDFAKYNFIMGWYGDDCIATAEDITSREVHIKNLNDDTEKIIKVDNNIIDYADKKFLVDSNNGFIIYDSYKNTKININDIGSEQLPKFIDGDGKYILMDKDGKYFIVEADSGKLFPIDAKIADYEAPNMVTGYPAVTMSDDHKKFYFTKNKEIRVSNLDTSEKSEKFADFPSNAVNAVFLRNVRNSNIMITELNCPDNTDGLCYYTINKDTKQFTQLKDISFFDSLNTDTFAGNQNGSCGKIVYCEKNKKNGLYFLYAGEIRDGKIARTKELVLDGLPSNALKYHWTWSASWNSTGSRIFIYVDGSDDEKFNAGYYADIN